MSFFDSSYQPISRDEASRLIRNGNYIAVAGDSVDHTLMYPRTGTGRIALSAGLLRQISEVTGRTIASDMPLLIRYYPGPDPCHESGTPSLSTARRIHSWAEEQLAQPPVYLYKSGEGLDKYRRLGVGTWYADPNNAVEEIFFERHFPCGSFVLLRPDGYFAAGYGEYGLSTIKDQYEELKAL